MVPPSYLGYLVMFGEFPSEKGNVEDGNFEREQILFFPLISGYMMVITSAHTFILKKNSM